MKLTANMVRKHVTMVVVIPEFVVRDVHLKPVSMKILVNLVQLLVLMVAVVLVLVVKNVPRPQV